MLSLSTFLTYRLPPARSQTWDRSHFLENLSGYETRCDMIGRSYHEFEYSKQEANSRGRAVVGLYGSARNRGSTPDALQEILAQMQMVCFIFFFLFLRTAK